MDSLVGYGSDDDNETERYTSHHTSMGHGAGGGSRRRDDDGTNYDDVNMDMSEDSQAESEPELPQAEPVPPRPIARDERQYSSEHRRGSHDRDGRRRDDRPRDRHRPDRDARPDDRHAIARADRDARPDDRHAIARADRDARSQDKHGRAEDKHGNRDVRPDEKYSREREARPEHRGERDRRGGHDGRRGLLGDRPDDRTADANKVPSLMELKPFGGEPPPSYAGRSQDARDAVSPRFVDRDRRDREKERERNRHGRRSEEKRERQRHGERPRSRSRDHDRDRDRDRDHSKPRATYAPPPESHAAGSSQRGSPPATSTSDYRPTSYKVNKKLEVMEKMGLQIKTPDGSMATAAQLRQAASESPAAAAAAAPAPHSYFAVHAGVGASKILDQVQKRKLLWSNKRSEAEEAARWSGTRFAQDSDGKQVSKFMRLMGIKEPNAVKQDPPASADPIKKQEELFQAMQAQYEVARATTHTMRGVGLGFQRGQF